MVVRRTMTANWFLPSARPAQQQQQTQGRNQPPLATCTRKRQRTADQPPKVSRDVPLKTPPLLHRVAWSFRNPLVLPAQLCRLGLTLLHPLLAQLWDGKQSLRSITSLSWWQKVLEIRPKVKVAERPEVWGKAYNFPKTCTSSLVITMNP